MKIRNGVILVVILMLSACATVNNYKEPVVSKGAPVTTVQGSSVRYSFGEGKTAMIKSIDNKEISIVWSPTPKLNILPGKHLFVIRSLFKYGLYTDPYDAFTEITATVKAGQNYHFNNKKDGAKVYVWLEDSKGKQVSDVASSEYHITPEPTIVPVIIPIVH